MVHSALKERGYAAERWAIDVDEIRGHPGFSPVAVNYENAISTSSAPTARRRRWVGR